MAGWSPIQHDFTTHPKTFAAGLDAAWLDLNAILWSDANGTDGFVPESSLRMLGVMVRSPKKQAAKLVEVGRWVVADGGWRIHDFEIYQRASERVKASKNAAARRQALHRNRELVTAIRARDGDRCRYCAAEVDWHDRKGLRGGTYDHIDPMGENRLDNLVVACRSCNSIKRNRTPEEALMQLLPPPSFANGRLPIEVE